jgi:hypothetical protein
MKDYFATLPTKEIGAALVERCNDYYNYVQNNGHYDLWRKTHKAMYSGYYVRGDIRSWGKNNEKRKIVHNHFSSILQHIKVLTTDQRPVFEPKAVNSDYKSFAQVILARGLLDYYMRQGNLEDVIDGCMDIALQAGEGYIFQEWNPDAGRVVEQMAEGQEDEGMEEEGYEDSEDDGEIDVKVRREGDIHNVSLHPLDMVRDYTKDTTEGNCWFAARRRVNKYDLAARYPKFKDNIINMELNENKNLSLALDDYYWKNQAEGDQIHLFTFRHAKSAALPEGRQVEFLEDGTVIFDGDLPYSDISIYRLMPQSMKNTNFGYSVAFDLLAIQDANTLLNSTIVTNQNAFGVQNIIAQKGSGVTATNLAGNLNLLEYSGDPKGKPEPLNLLSTPPEIFNYETHSTQAMETISGVNSVARGNPEASLRSGSALALVQSMSIQFNSGLQHSYVRMLEQLGSGIISMLKDYASAPRVALVAGISKKQYMKEFKGSDLELIDRVIVDIGNPMSKTQAGRSQSAEFLLGNGMIKTPEQYFQLMETGRLDPMIEGETAELMNVRSENERLAAGEQVNALYTDNHWIHIKEHKTVLASPDAREVIEIIQITDDHMKQHIELLRTTDPGILMILGQQPIPSPVNDPNMGAPVPPIPNQPSEDTPVQGQAGAAPTEADATPSGPGTTGIQEASLPKQPKNPLTGEQFNPDTGGL